MSLPAHMYCMWESPLCLLLVIKIFQCDFTEGGYQMLPFIASLEKFV